MTLGYLIANRRRKIGKTQQDIADALDVSIQAVSAWERDEYLPDTSKLKPLANAPKYFSRISDGGGNSPNRQMAAALKLMKKYHEGQYRKGKDRKH